LDISHAATELLALNLLLEISLNLMPVVAALLAEIPLVGTTMLPLVALTTGSVVFGRSVTLLKVGDVLVVDELPQAEISANKAIPTVNFTRFFIFPPFF
jgi:hypothetical protein